MSNRLGVFASSRVKPRHTRLSIAFLALTLLSTAIAYAQDHKSGHWSYNGDEGPSHWGDLKPEFAPCKAGHRQSPIDIRNPQKADLPPFSSTTKLLRCTSSITVIRS